MTDFVTAEFDEDPSRPRAIVVGNQADRVLQALDHKARVSVQAESLRILERCKAGGVHGSTRSAQLVVGEVQSGKTLSFTTVMALARDNRVPLIIVLAGTKNNLLDQTEERLQRDLGMDGDGGANPWRIFKNPNDDDAANIAQTLELWSVPNRPQAFKPTVVIFLLKHAGRINTASDSLQAAFRRLGGGAVEALIVDDEADQASLNVKAQSGQESAVYEAIQDLRDRLVHHTYLMYTATPQAPLLVAIADAVSPERVTVLTAGADYIGGEELFKSGAGNFVRSISTRELVAALDPTATVAPPSLEDALAFYLLALVTAQTRGAPRPLSMLVHPAATKDLHAKYSDWVDGILSRWQRLLSDTDDVAYSDLIESRFRAAYNDLRTTVVDLKAIDDDLEPLHELLAAVVMYLPLVERRVVNSVKSQNISEKTWLRFSGWIVIGGNKLDRGFTVQNLAVTYMPRGSGVGNADTIQQRGRFFGYKRPYLDLCRGWFSDELARIFRSYVEHEKSMQAELRALDEASLPVKNWRRKFLLDPSLRPTRRQVMTLLASNSVIPSGWAFRQAELYVAGLASKNAANVATIKSLILTHGEVDERDTRRPDSKRHRFAQWDYQSAAEFLASWECSVQEREELDQIQFLLTGAADDNDEPSVVIVAMDNFDGRMRSEASPGSQRINNLFQGRGSSDGQDRYPGDDFFRFEKAVTIQLHMVRPRRSQGEFGEVPALALALPSGFSRRVYWDHRIQS